jgi:hypothetical protein
MSGQDELRASDAERDRAVEVLAEASAEGRLTLEEYSARSEAALQARTHGELAVLTADIPDSPRASALSPLPAEARISALLGNETRKGTWVVPERLSVRSVLSDCHLEMQQAVIRQHITTIDVTVRLGSVTIFVPDGIDVRLSGRAVLGSKESQLDTAPRPGAPVLDIRCDVLLGAVTVRRPDFKMNLKDWLKAGAPRAAGGAGTGPSSTPRS